MLNELGNAYKKMCPVIILVHKLKLSLPVSGDSITGRNWPPNARNKSPTNPLQNKIDCLDKRKENTAYVKWALFVENNNKTNYQALMLSESEAGGLLPAICVINVKIGCTSFWRYWIPLVIFANCWEGSRWGDCPSSPSPLDNA